MDEQPFGRPFCPECVTKAHVVATEERAQLRAEKQAKKESRRIRFRDGCHVFTITQYESLLREQKGKCAICGHEPGPDEDSLAVDHEHGTSQVRGLLCRFCNLGLGHFRDDVKRLRAAADYLCGSPRRNMQLRRKYLETGT